MDLSDWQRQKIEILAQYQETLADIYTLLGERIPRCESLFLNIAMKNLKYGDWIRSVPGKIVSGEYEYEMLRFKIESITTGINYLIGQFKSLSDNNISTNQAVGILKAIESGDIARKFHEIVFTSDEYARELDKIKNEFKSEKIATFRSLQSVTMRTYAGSSLYC